MSQSADPRFHNVEVQYQTLRAHLNSGALTPEQFEAALQKLMILDEQGRYWMVGAESGRWYVYEGQAWVQRDPSAVSPVQPPTPVAPEAAGGPGPAAITQASFTPVEAAPPVNTAGESKRGRRSPVRSLTALILILLAGGAIALGYGIYSRPGAAVELATATPSQIQAAVTIPASPTSAPAATATAAAAMPTAAPTSVLQRTPTVIVIPTSLPTVRPTPTAAPAAPTLPPAPTVTDTPALPLPNPTRVLLPQFSASFTYQGYERWGSPNADCTAYVDMEPTWQFKWDVRVDNRSITTLNPSEWINAAFDDKGAEARVCAFNLKSIAAGQSGGVVFAAYVRYEGGSRSAYVSRVVHRIRNATFQRCLDVSWREVPC